MEALWRAAARFLIQPGRVDRLIARAKETPYSPIVKDGDVYMERYWLFNPYDLRPDGEKSIWARVKGHLPSVRLHKICRPDRDRHPHDHPWRARTIVLRGWYREARVICPKLSGASEYRFLGAGTTQRLELGDYHQIVDLSPRGEVWTMFITWKYQGTWGFLVNGAKVPWKKYLGLDKG